MNKNNLNTCAKHSIGSLPSWLESHDILAAVDFELANAPCLASIDAISPPVSHARY